MAAGISVPQFANEDEARQFLESVRWPNGPVCPHQGKRLCTPNLGFNSILSLSRPNPAYSRDGPQWTMI